MAMKYKYKFTDKNGNVLYKESQQDAAFFLGISVQSFYNWHKESNEINGYHVEKLDEPFEFVKPKVGAMLTIDGVECKVVAIDYANVFIVEVTHGDRRAVRYNDFSFVSSQSKNMRRDNTYRRRNAKRSGVK